MQIQLNTDARIQGQDSLAAWVEGELEERLARFRDQITRIEVHLSDVNGERVGGDEKRCLLEARLPGRPPVAVSHSAGKVADAVHGAADKMLRALGRSRDTKGSKGRESIRDAGSV